MSGFYLVCCTRTLLDEISNGFTQKQLAITYAMAMRSEAAGADKTDWPSVNRAIVKRWSMSGLVRVKDMAWRIARRPAALTELEVTP